MKLGLDVGNTLKVNGADELMPHCIHAVRFLRTIFGNEIYIISRVDDDAEEQRIRKFLKKHRISGELVAENHIHFCLKREDKGPIAAQLQLTHFVDDRTEVLSHMTSVRHRYALNPTEDQLQAFPADGMVVAKDWYELEKLMMNATVERPLIGIALCVRRGDQVMLHKRKGKHAPGAWAFAGGHLEMWEGFEICALRELWEEAGSNVLVTKPKFWTVANTRYYNEGKHYVVIIMIADWISGEPMVREPTKCECWEWFSWNHLPSPLTMGIQDIKDRGLALPI